MWMPFTHKTLCSKSQKEDKQSEPGLKAKHARPRPTSFGRTAHKTRQKGARTAYTAKKHTTANFAPGVCSGLPPQQGTVLSKLTGTAVSGGQLVMRKGARPLSSLLKLYKLPWLPKGWKVSRAACTLCTRFSGYQKSVANCQHA